MKFCIVTPSFNQAQFLEETIKSVVSQKGPFSVELFVADGGSTDGSTRILKKYAAKIEFVSEKDKGQTDAINKGIKYFSRQKDFDHETAVFAYINSDDYYLPGALETVARAFTDSPEADWVVGDAVIVDATGKEIQKAIRFYKRVWRALFSRFTLSVLNPIPQPSTFIRWKALKSTGFFDASLRYVMDYDYWHRLLAAKHQPLLLKTPLSCFRIHGESKGGSQFEKQFAEELTIAKKYTTNPLAIWLHRLHNLLIIGMYKLIK